MFVGSFAFLQSKTTRPGSAAEDKTAVREEPQPKSNPYVTITRAPKPDTMIYEDHWNALRFEYPSFLRLNDLGLGFRNAGDSNVIALYAEFSSTDPKGYEELRKYWPSVSFSKEIINGIPWVRYSAPGGAGYYFYRNYEEIAIEGVVEGNPRKPLSAAELAAMREIVDSLTFTSKESRMDFRIAAVKVGAKYGSVRVSRVVTRAMANGNRQKYWTNPAGEVDFSGTITLSGYIDNEQTMNSGPAWTLGRIEAGDCAKLPQIAYPISCSQLTNLQIFLTNADFIQQQFAKRTSEDEELTVVIDDLAEVFYGSGPPSFSAKLVKILDSKNTH
jgi:hypothetical protein